MAIMNSNCASPGFVFQVFGESKVKQQALFINKSLDSRNLIQIYYWNADPTLKKKTTV